VLTLGFLNGLQRRQSSLDPGTDAYDAMESLLNTVMDFTEEVGAGLASVAPVVAQQKKAADEIEKAAAATVKRKQAEAEAQTKAAAAGSEPPSRGAATAPPMKAAVERFKTPSLLSNDGGFPKGQQAAEKEQEREQAALSRFKVEKLLDAAKASPAALDKVLSDLAERGQLDGSFFDNMQWEVDQAVEKKNQRLLAILELVVQRACLQVEMGQPDVQLLSTLLQTANRDSRRELYEQRLATYDEPMRKRFASSVLETQMTLEKAVLRGESVDQRLLVQLRLVALEMGPFVAPTNVKGPPPSSRQPPASPYQP